MKKPCPADVILHFVIERIHEGHFDAVLALGFSWEQIRFLESLPGRDLHYLFNFAEHFIALQIDLDAAQARIAIQRVTEQQRLRETQQALLRAGAPRQLMIELYGWTATYYCDQRKFLGLDEDMPRGGRPQNPSPDAEDQILLQWEQHAERPLDERYLETARAVSVTVRQVRSTLERNGMLAESGGRRVPRRTPGDPERSRSAHVV